MLTMTARRPVRKPIARHIDEFGNPLRRVGFTEADRDEAAVLLNVDATDFDVVSAAPSMPSITKTARKPIFEHRRMTDEVYSPTENTWGYKNALEYDFGWTEAACVD